MRRFVFLGLAFVLLAVTSAPVFAWEYSMKGEAEWRYRYWTRTGNNDIFGTMDSTIVNLGLNHLLTFPTSATTNRGSGTFGVLAGENRFGADMCLNDYRVTIYPKIKVNAAIDLTASINLTSLGIWSDGEPLLSRRISAVTTVTGTGGPPLTGVTATSTAFGMGNPGYINSLYVPIQDRPVNVDVPNTYLTVQWLKLAIKTPMLNFSIGYKDSKIGMGLWKHSCNRASSSFSVSADYGPFKIGFSPYFAREQSSWALGTSRSRIEGNGSTQRQEDRRNYFHAWEGEVEYSNGPLVLQLVSDSYHQPNSPDVSNARGDALTVNRPTEDILRYRFAFAAKFNNGRLFANAEVDWFNRWRSGRGTAENSLLVREGRDNTAWIYGAEIGCFGGPSKVTVNYVRATGDDPSTRHTTEISEQGDSGVTACYMKEWGYLMYYMYGTGDGWDAAGYGQPTNFQHVGGKLDYAIAANLNIAGVFAYAWRDQPTSYRLGGNYRLGIQPWLNEDIRQSQLGTFRGHAVPDSARVIGWEADVAVDWKILENLTWRTIGAYWQPGNWWSYAYPNTAAIYRAGVAPNSNSTSSAAGEALAIRGIGRTIDPLMSVETSILVSF
jgi:hypothetical protein